MSLITKILVIIVFLAALIALGTTGVLFAMRVNEKDRFEKKCHDGRTLEDTYRIEIIRHIQERNDLAKGIDLLTREVQQLKRIIAHKDGEIARLYKEIDPLEIEIERYRADIDKLVQHIEIESTDVKRYQEKIEELRNKLNKVLDAKTKAIQLALEYGHKNDILQRHVELIEEKIINTIREIKVLEEKHEQLVKQLGYTSGPPVKATKAVVKQVDEKQGIVLINCGHDKQVKPHDKFTVHRKGTFVAIIRVVVVYQDYSTCVIEMTNTDQNLYPISGDEVYAK